MTGYYICAFITRRVIGYQQTVNSTFIEMRYFGGDAYGGRVEDVGQKENDQCKKK